MKPVTLQITGLNSFRQSVSVDFIELLKDGLFGIFGPTGSGKSTILDAITLALYGKVRRAPGGTGGIINMAEQSCSVSFTFAIGQPTARRRYTVERRLVRNKGGGIETKTARLIAYENDRPTTRADKAIEVRERIQEIVGIGHDDFQRAVVLPQNQFADFLRLEPRERSTMLERLFGLYEFGARLNQLLAERAKELELERARLDGRLAELREYSDEALASLADRYAEAQRLALRRRAERAAIAERHSAARLLYSMITERAALQAAEPERIEAEARLAELREAIALAERAATVAPGIAALESARRRHAEAEARYEETRASKDSAEAALDTVRPLFERATAAYEQRYDVLGEEIRALEDVGAGRERLRSQRARLRETEEQLQAAREQLVGLQREHDRTAEESRRIEGEERSLAERLEAVTTSSGDRELLTALARSGERWTMLTAECERIEGELAGAMRAIEQSDAALNLAVADATRAEEDLVRTREAIARSREREQSAMAERERLLDAFQRARDGRGVAARIEQDLESARADHARRVVDRDELGERSATAARESDAANAALESARSRFEELVALRETARREIALATLAHELNDGTPCPLCGSPHHPSPHDAGDRTGTLAAIESDIAEASTRVRAAEAAARDAGRAADGMMLQLKTAEEETGRLADVIAARAAELRAHLDSAVDRRTFSTVAELDEHIAAIMREGSLARAAADAAAAESNDLSQRLDDAGRLQTEAVARRATREAEAVTARRNADALRTSLAQAGSERDAAARSFEEMAGGRQLEQVMADIEEQRQRDRQAEELRSLVAEAAARSREMASRLEETAGRLRPLELNIAALASARDDLERAAAVEAGELAAAWERVVPEAERDAGTDLIRALARRNDERARVRADYERERERYERAHGDAKMLRELLEKYWADLCREERERDEADRACIDVLQREGFANVREAVAAQLEPAALAGLRARASDLAEQVARSRMRLAELDEKIGDQAITAEEMALLDEQLTEAERAFEETSGGELAIREELARFRDKNAEYRSVMEENRVGMEGKATTDQLVRYLRSNGFIDFLANERLADVCLRATTQLAALTGGRFEILTRPKEGFIIRDNASAGAERSPSSLSGGETFLVSLSLALALSDTIQLGHAPLEFFFLDEGFGTLDSDLLETVMNALERLRSDHRAIGVISHVTQLRERITRRLIVEPAHEGAGSSVHFELG